MGISATRDKGYGTGVHGAAKSSVGNLFASSFLWKIVNPPSNHKNSKYIAGKKIWTWPTLLGEIKIKLNNGYHLYQAGTNLVAL